MIKNAIQRAAAERKLAEVLASLAHAKAREQRVWRELADRVEDELAEYDAIVRGSRSVFQLAALDDLPDALVKARLARGWSQKQLAREIGVSEQMVQKDEAGGYESASLARLADVAQVLGYQLLGRLQPADAPAQVAAPDVGTHLTGPL